MWDEPVEMEYITYINQSLTSLARSKPDSMTSPMEPAKTSISFLRMFSLASSKKSDSPVHEVNIIGFERGLEPEEIQGTSVVSGHRVFLIKWRGSKAKAVDFDAPSVSFEESEKRGTV